MSVEPEPAGHPEQFGLRERKRIATKRAIEVAALELVTSRGLDKTTVDEISRIADISPRTFFNYFPSKEAAIAGDSIELTNDSLVDDFVSGRTGTSILDGLSILLSSSVDSVDVDAELQLKRRSLLKQYPELFALRMAAMRSFEDHLTDVIGQRLAREQPELAEDAAALLSRARLITHVAFGAMRHAWTAWAEHEQDAPLGVRIYQSFEQLHAVLTPVAVP